MILSRYIYKDVITSSGFTLLLLVSLAMGGRVTAYLTEVTLGNLAVDAVLPIVFFRLPSVVESILPTSYFLGLILVFGRMHTDREMVSITASGVGEWFLYSTVFKLSLIFSLILAGVSLWVRPVSQDHVDRIWEQQENLSELDLLIPARFNNGNSGKRVIYIASKNDEVIDDFFMADYSQNSNGEKQALLTRAKSGIIETGTDRNDSYLILNDGVRVSLDRYQSPEEVTEFATLSQIFSAHHNGYATRRNAIPTLQLVHSSLIGEQAELMWRISMGLMLLIICPLAIPLSYVDPRMGKYAKLLPGISIVLLYQGLLATMKATVEKETLPVIPGFLLVHGFFIVAVFFTCFCLPRLKRFFSSATN